MSDATDDLPSQAELDANSVPAMIRRAPRFARIIATGAGAGFVFGVIVALGLPGHGAEYRALVALLVGLGLAMIGALTAGAIATRADGRDPGPLRPADQRLSKAEEELWFGSSEPSSSKPPKPKPGKDG